MSCLYILDQITSWNSFHHLWAEGGTDSSGRSLSPDTGPLTSLRTKVGIGDLVPRGQGKDSRLVPGWPEIHTASRALGTPGLGKPHPLLTCTLSCRDMEAKAASGPRAGGSGGSCRCYPRQGTPSTCQWAHLFPGDSSHSPRPWVSWSSPNSLNLLHLKKRPSWGAAALVHLTSLACSHHSEAWKELGNPSGPGRGGERLSPWQQTNSQPPNPGHKSARWCCLAKETSSQGSRGLLWGGPGDALQQVPWGDGGPAAPPQVCTGEWQSRLHALPVDPEMQPGPGAPALVQFPCL